MDIRSNSDAGKPVVACDPEGPHAAFYEEIAARVLDQLELSLQSVEQPEIVFE